MHTRRSGLLALACAVAFSCALTGAGGLPELRDGVAAAAVAADAGPAPVADAPPVVVDPETGAVTPQPGSLPDRAAQDPAGVLQDVYRDIRDGGSYRQAAAGVLALLMVLGVRFFPKVFGHTDRGRAIGIMALSLLAVTAIAFASNEGLTLSLFTGAFLTGLTAVGGRQWLSRILWPADGPAVAEWLRPFLGVKPK